MQPLPPEVRRLWRISAIGLAAGLAVAVGVVDFFILQENDAVLPPAVLPIAVFIVVGGLGVVIADAYYHRWRFELTEDWIQARWGVIGRRTATVPRNRVQTVTSENGPIDRLLGLTSITVHTAGVGAPNLDIPHLDDGTVEWLRSELARGAVT
ncbi:MAG: PH domain-containing protein [Actinomycetota bacterium]